MTGLETDAALSAKQVQEAELVGLKRRMDGLKNAVTPSESKEKQLRKACTDFEAVFLDKLWQRMRATVPKDPIFDTEETDMYRSIFDHDLAEKMAQDGGIGLGNMLYTELKEQLKNVTKSPKAAKAAAAAAGHPYKLNALRASGSTSAEASSADVSAGGSAAGQSSSAAVRPDDATIEASALAGRIVAASGSRGAQADAEETDSEEGETGETDSEDVGRKLAEEE